MSQGKKYNDDVREKARTLLSANNNLRAVARELGIAESTLRAWKKEFESESGDDSFAQLRAQKKKEFITSSWRLIDKTTKIIERRLDRALESEDALDEVTESFVDLKAKDASYDKKLSVFNKMRAVKVESLKEMAILLGTIYDKQESAGKEPEKSDGGEEAENNAEYLREELMHRRVIGFGDETEI